MDKPFPTKEYWFFVLGSEARTDRVSEAGEGAKIAELVQRVQSEDFKTLVPDKIAEGKLFVVYFDYQSDHTGPYSVVAGYQVSSLASVPSGLTGLSVEGGKYLLFTCEGYHKAVASAEAWAYIHDYFAQEGAPTRAFASDYEVWHDTRVEVFVSVES